MAAQPLLAAAPKVVKRDYQGMGPTVRKVAAYVRECGDSPEFRAFASQILDGCFPRSQHTTVLQRAQCLLTYMNKNVRFVPDSPGSEVMTNPKNLLCLPGYACIPLEDCESHAAAYLALCRATGIDVWLLLQKLDKPNTDPNDPDGKFEFHMAGALKLDDGSQVRVDPSLKGSSKVGQAQPAIEEQLIDPLDPNVTGSSGGAKLVQIGATPRIMYRVPASIRPMFGAKACCSDCAKSGGKCGDKKKKPAVIAGTLRQMAAPPGR